MYGLYWTICAVIFAVTTRHDHHWQSLPVGLSSSRVQFERRETKRTLLIYYLFHPHVTVNGRSLPGQESLAVHSVHMLCGFI